MCTIPYISESTVHQLLNWDRTFEAIEKAMASVSQNRAFQSARTKIKLSNTPDFMFVMPGYLQDDKYPALGYKVFTVFPNNTKRSDPLSPLTVNLTLLDENTGELKAIIAGKEITEWRTAAASVIATKYLHGGNSGKENNILAILGAGGQGRAHAIALQRYFNFKEVRIWNRTPERAKKLVDELNKGQSTPVFKAVDTVQECLKDADVVVTATNGASTLVKLEWLKKGAHVNAIAVNPNNLELEDDVYKNANVYIDYWDGARNELPLIQKLGVEFKGQIGDLIVGKMLSPNVDTTTVFQSLGISNFSPAARTMYKTHEVGINFKIPKRDYSTGSSKRIYS